jgi:hypothetical protein
MQDFPATFGADNFGTLKLGNKRRAPRLAKLMDLLLRHPGGSLPDKLNRPADLRAFYKLMDRPEVTHAVVLGGHAEHTRRAIAALEPGTVVLLLHDATELDFTSKKTLLASLGQIGPGSHRGYICHNSLAVRADSGETLGLTSQLLHHRADVPKKETAKQSRERLNRESRLWPRGAAASGLAPAGIRCVDVSDSLSDTFEYLAYEMSHGREFVLRARENRKLVEPVAKGHFLLDAARRLPPAGEHQITVLDSPTRQARTATVRVAFAPATIAAPGEKLGDYDAKSLDLWIIRVWEPKPPKAEEPLEWILLTNVPVANYDDARERIAWYERRPIIEEYHKGMKTGCSIEGMQFATIQRLEPAIAVVSVLATTLLRLRDAARLPDADVRFATAVVAAEYVQVLTDHYGKRLGAKPSVRKFFMHVARLGGHQNRKADGLPGWITLWRGWMKLQCMVDGHRAAQRRFRQKHSKT